MVCSVCKCVGHNKRTCPTTGAAPPARVSFSSLHAAAHAAQSARLTAMSSEEFSQYVAGGVAPPTNQRRKKPTHSEVKIQEILFENCQEIPDGIYKQLMDALVIA